MPLAATIGVLRRAGMSLGEIAAFVGSPSVDRIDKWRTALDTEVAERRRLLDHVAPGYDQPEVPAMADDPTPTTMERAIPVLASLDIEATQRFHAEKTGFQPGPRHPDDGIVVRDGVQIHFWLTDDADIAKATSCRIDVIGIDRLHEEMLATGVVHPNGPLTDQPWGYREFATLDGDGNLIKFGEQTEQ